LVEADVAAFAAAALAFAIRAAVAAASSASDEALLAGVEFCCPAGGVFSVSGACCAHTGTAAAPIAQRRTIEQSFVFTTISLS
jgi:hypothetical protein